MNPLTTLRRIATTTVTRIANRLLAAPAWVADKVDAHYAGALGGEDE